MISKYPPKEPLVSIVIPTWNGQKWLKDCFTSIKKQSYSQIEVILVDNNSSDNTEKWVKDHFKWVKVVKSKSNLGYGNANNLGANIAKGSLLFFLNNDTKLLPNAISKLVKYKALKSLNIVGPRILNPEGKETYGGKYIGIDPLSVHGWSKKTFYIDGCALLVSKKDFFELGGFDPAYFTYNEDIDLCWRAWLYGMSVGLLDDALLYHFSGGTSIKTTKTVGIQHTTSFFRRYEVEKNNLRNLLKNYHLFNLIWVVPLYLIQQISEAVLHLVTGNAKMAGVLVQAIIWNLNNFNSTLTLRKKIQTYRKIPDSFILKLMTFRINKLYTFTKIGLPKFT